MTVISVLCWIGITFVAEPVRNVPDPENENATITVEVPQLMVGAWYPWDARHGMPYLLSFAYQVSASTGSRPHTNIGVNQAP